MENMNEFPILEFPVYLFLWLTIAWQDLTETQWRNFKFRAPLQEIHSGRPP